VRGIVGLVRPHRYAEAAREIGALLVEGTRLVRWEDPEIMLLERELEREAGELARVEGELAELRHRITQFQVEHTRALGGRIEELMRLRQELNGRAAVDDPAQEPAHEEARQAYEAFCEDRRRRAEEEKLTGWELGEEEQLELKRLFRKVALEGRTESVRAALGRVLAELEELKWSPVYRLLGEVEDLGGYFEEQGRELDEEIRRVRSSLGGSE
jgi:chromosome segregation ATPase